MKKFINTVLVFLFLIALAVVALNLFYVPRSDKEATPYRVDAVTGGVFVKIAASVTDPVTAEKILFDSRWLPVTKGMRLKAGDTLKTDDNAEATIVIDGGMVMKVRADTEFTFEENEKEGGLLLEYGKVLVKAVLKHMGGYGDGGRAYRVRTATAVAGIRGTTFSVAFAPYYTPMTVGVLTGVVRVSMAGGGQPMDVTPGKKAVVEGGITLTDLTLAERDELSAMEAVPISTSFFRRFSGKGGQHLLSFATDPAFTAVARYKLGNLEAEVVRYAMDKGGASLPEDLRSMGLGPVETRDPWKSEIRLFRIEDKRAVLLSPGPDKTPFTGDDITLLVRLP